MRLILRRLNPGPGDPIVEVPTVGDSDTEIRNWCMLYMLQQPPCPIELMWRLGKLTFTERFDDSARADETGWNDLSVVRQNMYLKLVEFMFFKLLDRWVPHDGIYRVEVEGGTPTRTIVDDSLGGLRSGDGDPGNRVH